VIAFAPARKANNVGRVCPVELSEEIGEETSKKIQSQRLANLLNHNS
jgi:hypothetical protein